MKAKTQRNLVGTVVMVAGLLGGSRVLRADGHARPIVVHVDNYAKLPAAILADAQNRAAAIYAAAGVQTVWVSGDSDVAAVDASALHVRVVLLSQAGTDRLRKIFSVEDTVMGLAVRAARRAYILCPRIASLVIQKGGLMSDVLGRVLAHEVGHLVLATGHSDRGIMRADLEVRSGVSPRFTDAQVTSMFAELILPSRTN